MGGASLGLGPRPPLSGLFLPLPPRIAPRRLHRLGGVGGEAPPLGEFPATLLPRGPSRRTAVASLHRAEVRWRSRAALGGYEAPGPELAPGFGWFCRSRMGWPRRVSGRLRHFFLPSRGLRLCSLSTRECSTGKGLTTY